MALDSTESSCPKAWRMGVLCLYPHPNTTKNWPRNRHFWIGDVWKWWADLKGWFGEITCEFDMRLPISRGHDVVFTRNFVRYPGVPTGFHSLTHQADGFFYAPSDPRPAESRCQAWFPVWWDMFPRFLQGKLIVVIHIWHHMLPITTSTPRRCSLGFFGAWIW